MALTACFCPIQLHAIVTIIPTRCIYETRETITNMGFQ
jgi:hypothetical protein